MGTSLPATGRELDLSAHFTEVEEATFVVLDARTGQVTRFRPERARVGFRPASTFKIPNTVIALETGVARGAEFRMPWDSVRVPRTAFFPDSWAREQTLRTAFRNSVYWFYQEVARRVGEARMAAWLVRFDYGNRTAGPRLDTFWLSGELRISADEQVVFLRRLLGGGFGVAPRTLEVLREMALLDSGPGWRLYGKTGTSDVTPTRENGWIVGWVERPGGTAYYAVNLEGETVWEAWPPQRRTELAVGLLRTAGVLP